MVLGAWDAFIEQAARVDLDRRSRLPGWRAHEICVHLGSWEDHQALRDLVASARAGGLGEPPDPDAVNVRVTAAHRTALRPASEPSTPTTTSGAERSSVRSASPGSPSGAVGVEVVGL